MKWLRIITIVLIVLIVVSIIITTTLTQTYAAYKGDIDGTGFVLQEIDGAGGIEFDVDDLGNIYFAISNPGGSFITIYNNQGEYKHTLLVSAGGGISVKINSDNEILVYDFRRDHITQFNDKGIEINKISDEHSKLRSEFSYTSDENVRERNGIRYINTNGTITKVENDTETVVFTVPVWQRWNRAFTLVTILSCVALFFRIAIPLWIKAFKERYG